LIKPFLILADSLSKFLFILLIPPSTFVDHMARSGGLVQFYVYNDKAIDMSLLHFAFNLGVVFMTSVF
jgi:hypothetical protein